MAKVAPPAPVVVDVVELGDLGDVKPFPPPTVIPWAPGDEPLWESVDLNELPNEVLKMKVCRSFRADLRHKLILIIRASGGYGHGGVNEACKSLHVRRVTLYRWLSWKTTPRNRHNFERIDSAYEEAVRTLVAREMARRSKRKRAKA